MDYCSLWRIYKGYKVAFYFLLAINRNLCYTYYSIMISLRIFEKINKKIKIFLKIMQPNQNLVVYISVGHLTDRRKDARQFDNRLVF